MRTVRSLNTAIADKVVSTPNTDEGFQVKGNVVQQLATTISVIEQLNEHKRNLIKVFQPHAEAERTRTGKNTFVFHGIKCEFRAGSFLLSDEIADEYTAIHPDVVRIKIEKLFSRERVNAILKDVNTDPNVAKALKEKATADGLMDNTVLYVTNR